MTTDKVMNTCDMVIIEDHLFRYFWECSACQKQFKDTLKFQKAKTCPNCLRLIDKWIDQGDDDDDE